MEYVNTKNINLAFIFCDVGYKIAIRDNYIDGTEKQMNRNAADNDDNVGDNNDDFRSNR
jgi:hypothetical protein